MNVHILGISALMPVIAVLLPVAGCGTSPGLPVGATYEDVTGAGRIVVRSATELDIVDEGDIYQGHYSVQDDGNIRIAATVLGTAIVVHFSRIDGGLREIRPDGTHGETLYDSETIAQARRDAYCGLLVDEVEALANAQVERLKMSGRIGFAVTEAEIANLHRLRDGVSWDVAGVPVSWFVVHARHPQCEEVYQYHSGDESRQGFLTRDEVAAEWAGVLASVADERARIEARRERLMQRWTTPTRELGRATARTARASSPAYSDEQYIVTDVSLEYRVLRSQKRIWLRDVSSIQLLNPRWDPIIWIRLPARGHLLPAVVDIHSARGREEELRRLHAMLEGALASFQSEYREALVPMD